MQNSLHALLLQEQAACSIRYAFSYVQHRFRFQSQCLGIGHALVANEKVGSRHRRRGRCRSIVVVLNIVIVDVDVVAVDVVLDIVVVDVDVLVAARAPSTP